VVFQNIYVVFIFYLFKNLQKCKIEHPKYSVIIEIREILVTPERRTILNIPIYISKFCQQIENEYNIAPCDIDIVCIVFFFKIKIPAKSLP
jgi:hypothetical protein